MNLKHPSHDFMCSVPKVQQLKRKAKNEKQFLGVRNAVNNMQNLFANNGGDYGCYWDD